MKSYETKVYKLKERLRVVYYNDKQEMKKKDFKLTKCGFEEGKKKVNDFLDTNKLSFTWC